jgi:flagellar basal body rod protein FlgB
MLGRASLANPLKEQLDISAQRTKAIADRVARASVSSADGFSIQSNGTSAANGDPVDLETEMTSLADEELHFEATSKLLSKAYEQLRLAIRDK